MSECDGNGNLPLMERICAREAFDIDAKCPGCKRCRPCKKCNGVGEFGSNRPDEPPECCQWCEGVGVEPRG